MIIYKIVNNINGKIYIGQTKNALSQRIAAHIRDNKTPVQKAINKYGLESFTISVIDEADSKEILKEKEKYWIKTLDCKIPKGYNIADGGDGKMSPEGRAAIAKSNKARAKNKNKIKENK